MAEDPSEIPQTMDELAEQKLKQAHAAYDQFTDQMNNAMEAWTSALPSNPMTAALKGVQDRVMEIAKENVEATFTFAGNVSKAKTVQEALTLQTRFAQDWMQASVKATKGGSGR